MVRRTASSRDGHVTRRSSVMTSRGRRAAEPAPARRVLVVGVRVLTELPNGPSTGPHGEDGAHGTAGRTC